MADLICFNVLSLCRGEQIMHIGTLNTQNVSFFKQVEIHPGTGVMVEKLAWAYAVNANSATVFVRHLLTAVFPVEILLVSNLRGGKRVKGDARLPLDKNKLDAIYSKFSVFNGIRPCFVLFLKQMLDKETRKRGQKSHTPYQHSRVSGFSASCVKFYKRCREHIHLTFLHCITIYSIIIHTALIFLFLFNVQVFSCLLRDFQMNTFRKISIF